jgi:hypothetical protein
MSQRGGLPTYSQSLWKGRSRARSGRPSRAAGNWVEASSVGAAQIWFLPLASDHPGDERGGRSATLVAKFRCGVLPHFGRRCSLWASPPTLNAFDANTQTGVTLMRLDGVLAFIER